MGIMHRFIYFFLLISCRPIWGILWPIHWCDVSDLVNMFDCVRVGNVSLLCCVCFFASFFVVVLCLFFLLGEPLSLACFQLGWGGMLWVLVVYPPPPVLCVYLCPIDCCNPLCVFKLLCVKPHCHGPSVGGWASQVFRFGGFW